MPYMTRIAADLIAAGLDVEYVPGWETRGSPVFAPGGVVCHWTAGPRGTTGRPSLRVVVDGWGVLPGPLCNVYLARTGVPVIVAAGRANHAGRGSWRGLVGNSAVYGIEGESAGDGDWTAAQRDAYPRVVAALLRGMGRGAEWGCGHNEWAPDRKVDIRDWPMAVMRAQVAGLLSASTVSDTVVIGGHVIPPGVPTPAPGDLPGALTRTQEDDMGIRIRNVNGGIYYVDLTKGQFQALTPEQNIDVDRLGVGMIQVASQYERDRIRQTVIDLSQPRIDG